MKNYFVFIFALLLISCNNDDSTPLEQGNIDIAPSGALISTDTFYPTLDYNVNSNYGYDVNGSVSSAVSTGIQTGFPNSITTVNYMTNSEGQIWKIISTYFSHEYQFSNGLITSSIQTRFSTGTVTTEQYTYNSNNDLVKSESFDENGVSSAVTLYTYDVNGSILTTDKTTLSGASVSYIYEYDTNNNPQYAVYANQEISKILETSPNNKTKRTYDNNGTVNVFTAEYTYNTEGYPVAKTEYQNVTTLVEETTFAYQP